MKESNTSGNTKKFFDNHANALFKKLLSFKKAIAVDSASIKQEEPRLINTPNDSLAILKSLQQWQFTSSIETQTFLSSLQSDILRSEQQHLIYFLESTARVGPDFEVFEAIVGQNAKILKAGDDLEITAGLGSVSRTKLPEINIAGKQIPLNDRGLVVYKMKTPKRLGSYSVPVKVQFTDQDGKQQERTFTVEYQVVDMIVKQ